MNLIGYLRLSKDENGNGLSLQAQRTAIKRWARGSDDEVVEWLEDVASGKNMERPGLQAALRTLETGEAEGLIVAKLDRVSRSLRAEHK
jgi:DNA invertase Pin-like site-specific DNA recombinase